MSRLIREAIKEILRNGSYLVEAPPIPAAAQQRRQRPAPPAQGTGSTSQTTTQSQYVVQTRDYITAKKQEMLDAGELLHGTDLPDMLILEPIYNLMQGAVRIDIKNQGHGPNEPNICLLATCAIMYSGYKTGLFTSSIPGVTLESRRHALGQKKSRLLKESLGTTSLAINYLRRRLAGQSAKDAMTAEISSLVKNSRKIADPTDVRIGTEALVDAAGNSIVLSSFKNGSFIRLIKLSDLGDEMSEETVKKLIDNVRKAKGLSDSVEKIYTSNTLGDLMNAAGVTSPKQLKFSPAGGGAGVDEMAEKLGLLLDEAEIAKDFAEAAAEGIKKGMKAQGAQAPSLPAEMIAAAGKGARQGAVQGAEGFGSKILGPAIKYVVGYGGGAAVSAEVIMSALDWVDDPQEPDWVARYGTLGDKSAAVKDQLLLSFDASQRKDFYEEIEELTKTWFGSTSPYSPAILSYAEMIKNLT